MKSLEKSMYFWNQNQNFAIIPANFCKVSLCDMYHINLNRSLYIYFLYTNSALVRALSAFYIGIHLLRALRPRHLTEACFYSNKYGKSLLGKRNQYGITAIKSGVKPRFWIMLTRIDSGRSIIPIITNHHVHLLNHYNLLLLHTLL